LRASESEPVADTAVTNRAERQRWGPGWMLVVFCELVRRSVALAVGQRVRHSLGRGGWPLDVRNADRSRARRRTELDAVDLNVVALSSALEHVVEQVAGVAEGVGPVGDDDRRVELHARSIARPPARPHSRQVRRTRSGTIRPGDCDLLGGSSKRHRGAVAPHARASWHLDQPRRSLSLVQICAALVGRLTGEVLAIALITLGLGAKRGAGTGERTEAPTAWVGPRSSGFGACVGLDRLDVCSCPRCTDHRGSEETLGPRLTAGCPSRTRIAYVSADPPRHLQPTVRFALAASGERRRRSSLRSEAPRGVQGSNSGDQPGRAQVDASGSST
jgi:hypothetical protein